MDSNITKAVIKAATAAKADKNAEDYYKDGVLVCGKCHTNKEKKIQLAGECVTVRCICKCESEERERIQKQKDYEEEMRRIERLKVASLMDAKLKSATLKTFTQKEDNQKLYTIVKNYVDNFETFYKSNRGLLFWGTVGTGKSYAAASEPKNTGSNDIICKSLAGHSGQHRKRDRVCKPVMCGKAAYH